MRLGLSTFLAIVQKAHVVDSFELGWLVGLLEGEGSFSTTWEWQKGEKKYHIPKVVLAMTDLDVVERYRDLVNKYFPPTVNRYGRIQGKPLKVHTRKREKHYKDIHDVRMVTDRALALMALVYPYMSERRKAQIDNVKKITVHEKTYKVFPGKRSQKNFQELERLQGLNNFQSNRTNNESCTFQE